MNHCCISNEERESRRIHNEIEKQLEIDRMNMQPEKKLLLFGSTESGKSTILKQMRIIHGEGYSEEERRAFTKHIFRNIFKAVSSLIRAMRTLQIPFKDDKNTEYAAIINNVDTFMVETMEAHYAEAIKSLWSDHGMQQCFDRRREFQLLDSAKYFLDDMDRISSENYLPTVQDILRVRIYSTHCKEYVFDHDSLIFRMIDIGSWTHKWKRIHPFEDVAAIIYLASLSEYDQYEIPNENRLMDSVDLFKCTIGNLWLQHVPIILLLNKADLLQEKISKSHLADYFPEYQDPKCDPEAAKKFILEMYKKQNSYERMYSYYTCATDTENIRLTFEEIKDIIKFPPPRFICF